MAREGRAEDDREHRGPALEGASSSELIRKVQEGEDGALQILLVRYLPILRRWTTGRLPGWARDLVDTDDVVQETLMGTLRNLDAFEPRHAGAFGAYLRRAMNNRIRDEVRKAQVRPQRAEMPDDHPDDSASPLEAAIGRQAMERYEAALERLSEADRELVVARIEMGLSYREIAEAAQKPSPDAARMSVARALVRMAKEMDPD